MMFLTSRARRVAMASLLQFALVGLAVAGQLSARLTGEDYLLEVAPVDPIDPFRGAYVALAYPGLPDSAEGMTGRGDESGDVAYVPLVRSGRVWIGRAPAAERPESAPFLRCQNDHGRLRCGIESWFLPQAEASTLEQTVHGGRAVATVRVDSRGNAALVDVGVPDE